MISFSQALFARLRVLQLQADERRDRFRDKAVFHAQLQSYTPVQRMQFEQALVCALLQHGEGARLRARVLQNKWRRPGGAAHARICELRALRRDRERATAKLRRVTPEARATMKKWRDANRGRIQANAKRWALENPEKHKAMRRATRVRQTARGYGRDYQRRRAATDLHWTIRKLLSSRILHAVNKQGADKSGRTRDLIGCSILELVSHLEQQFKPGMSWENRGLHGWHIDHVKPCDSFDLTKPEQQRECFHFLNLQPLWAKDNLSKGNKYAATQ